MATLPSYLKQALEHAKDVRPGEIVHVEVRHDDDCGIFENRACDCAPEVESGRRVDRKYGERG